MEQRRRNKKRTLLIIAGIVQFCAMLILINLLYLNAVTPGRYMIQTQNHFESQFHKECAGCASAYTLRSLGENVVGIDLYNEIEEKNPDGTVNPDAVVKMIEAHGRKASVNLGYDLLLKYYVSRGVPVIVLCREKPTSQDLHYFTIVGYDETTYYAAESLGYLSTENDPNYNRKISKEEMEELWEIGYPVKNIMIVVK